MTSVPTYLVELTRDELLELTVACASEAKNLRVLAAATADGPHPEAAARINAAADLLDGVRARLHAAEPRAVVIDEIACRVDDSQICQPSSPC